MEHAIMRGLNLKKKTLAFAVAGGLTVATAGGAYAYWTTTGSGTGSATTRAGATVFTVAGGVANAMYPGDSAQTGTATVTNTGSENYKVQSLKAYLTTDKPGCTGADYLLNGAAAPSTNGTAADLAITPVDLAPAATASKTFTLQFNNTAANQDACKSAVVTINYLAS